MSNIVGSNIKYLTFEQWVQRPEFVRGFLSVYNDEPFDYDTGTRRYELGRQLAVMAKLDGLRRSDLVRKKPKVDQYAFVKTRLSRLEALAAQAGIRGKFATV